MSDKESEERADTGRDGHKDEGGFKEGGMYPPSPSYKEGRIGSTARWPYGPIWPCISGVKPYGPIWPCISGRLWIR